MPHLEPPVARATLEESQFLAVVVQFGLTLVSQIAGEEVKVATVEAVFLARYELAEGAAPAAEDVQTFASFNGLFTVYPYWREFVNASLARAGLPRVSIPPMVPGREGAFALAAEADEAGVEGRDGG